jgi:FKBP-type peptidyl-prolyl cis-trans isomerase (trigger factor)
MEVLRQRYGTRARADAVNRIAAETTQRLIPKHSVVASFDLRAGADTGDLEFDAKTTYLPDLPAVDFSTLVLERLSTAPEDLQAARLGEAEAALLLRNHLKLQVLDQLDAAYHIPLLPLLIERELAKVWQAAEPEVPASAAERESVMAELRAIAERRVRLGGVVAEIARRNGIEAQDRAELENKVVDFLVAHARVQDRKASLAELRELAGGE